MPKIDRALLDRFTSSALECVRASVEEVSGERCAPPEAVALLLRQYAATGRDDLRDAAGAGLAHALHEACVASGGDECAAWLALFVEAAALSDDERVVMSIASLFERFSSSWPARGRVTTIFQTLRSMIAAAPVVSAQPGAGNPLARVIDELERVVGHAYTPGSGIVHEVGGAPGRGTLADHGAAAMTLLEAHAATGRLPYAMLADELVQFARREWWTHGVGWRGSVADACEASRAMCRLAALYRDDEYRQAAVLAPLDYAREAEHAIAALEPCCATPRDAALCGLAVFELLEIQSAI